MKKTKTYREIIDALAHECHNGQGQIVSKWIENNKYPEDPEVVEFFKKLSSREKEILTRLVSKSFEDGVFNSLKILETFQITPFEDGYEGSSYNDFIGRLDKNNPWQWPND